MNKLTGLLCALSLLCGSLNYCMEKDEKENQERYFDEYDSVTCTQLAWDNFQKVLSPEEKKALDLIFKNSTQTKDSDGVITFKNLSLGTFSDRALVGGLRSKMNEIGFLNHVYLGTVTHEDLYQLAAAIANRLQQMETDLLPVCHFDNKPLGNLLGRQDQFVNQSALIVD